MPLYSLGSNSSHQLSLQHTKDVSFPSRTTFTLSPDDFPTKIVAGANHTLLLTNKGSLYATGANRYGQCLTAPCDFVIGFRKVAENCRDCAATWEGSVVVRRDRTVWSFGNIKNHANLQGVEWDSPQDCLETVNEIEEGPHVVAGVQHFVLFDSGKAVGYGDGKKGQFGGTLTDSISTNAKGAQLTVSDIAQIACGKDFTTLLTNAGELKVFTSNGKYHLTSIPPLNNIKQITASWSTIAVLDHSGRVNSWGRSDRGQFPPANLPRLAHIAGGSEHFLGLSQDGQVFAWGWNEHGNCGTEDRNDVRSVHAIPVPAEEKASYIGAGCGTSWIWTERV